MKDHPGRFRAFLEGLATVAMIAASSGLLWALVTSRGAGSKPTEPKPPAAARDPKPLPSEPVTLEGAALRGSNTAKVGLLEFSDFECPACLRYHSQTYPDVVKTYVDTGKVLVAFRHLPLTTIHPLAQRAAEAAECAGRQGKFWELHDELFRQPRQLDADGVRRKAALAGIDVPALNTCLASGVAFDVSADVDQAREFSISGTPTFLFGTITNDGRLKVARRESGAVPYRAMSKMLDALLTGSASQGARK